MTAKTSNEIVTAFLDALVKHPGAHAAYVSNPAWTPLATAALIDVGVACSTGSKVRAAARGTKDPDHGRSEYLTLDVCVYDDSTWGPPLFIAEHENSRDIDKIKYCAWKLLVTEASRRVLIAYYSASVGMKGLIAAVREVAAANPGARIPRDILLIAAPWDARPANNEHLRAAFQSSIVGVLGE